MQKTVFDITMSLDGFIAGPNISKEHPLGERGERLHRWIFDEKTDIDSSLLSEIVETSGAVIVGGNTYATAIDTAWGGTSPFTVPAFVLSKNESHKPVTGFSYISTGVMDTLAKARVTAGDKNIWVMGGANIGRKFLSAGLLDQLRIHIVSVILGSGTRLFDHWNTSRIELTKTKVIESPAVTHLFFDIKKGRKN